jgi:hypothetical protein
MDLILLENGDYFFKEYVLKKIIDKIIYFFYRVKDFFKNPKYSIWRPLQVFFRGYSYADWWSASYILSKRMLPVLKMLRDKERHGVPSLIGIEEKEKLIAMGYEWDEDTYSFSDKEIDGKTAFNRSEEIWQYIINEICFALEYCAYEDDTDCEVPNPLYNPEQKEVFHFVPCEDRPGFSEMIHHDDYGKTIIDRDLQKAKMERVQKGLELMGKYWMNLWD